MVKVKWAKMRGAKVSKAKVRFAKMRETKLKPLKFLAQVYFVFDNENKQESCQKSR